MQDLNSGKENRSGRVVMESNCAQDTFCIGQLLGEKAKAGMLFCLDGELGTGKTVFAKGFAKGLGITEPVNSPTFTILQEYKGGRLPLYHFDVYRIGSPEEMDELGYEDYFYGDGVCLVEWASRISEVLPADTIYIKLEKDLEKGLSYRRIVLIFAGEGSNEDFSY